jgi:hypothetical protein
MAQTIECHRDHEIVIARALPNPIPVATLFDSVLIVYLPILPSVALLGMRDAEGSPRTFRLVSASRQTGAVYGSKIVAWLEHPRALSLADCESSKGWLAISPGSSSA